MSTTSPALHFVQEIISRLPGMFADATIKAWQMIWTGIMQLWAAHWISITLFVLFLLVASAVTAFTTGRWGWFGSVLYHILFIGALFLIGIIFGPEVFANDYFKIVLFLLYLVCFWVVGKVLRATGLKRW